MTPEQKQIVRETWQQVTPIADQAAGLFYDRLFEIDASTRPLFREEDMAEQRRKLMLALTTVVRSLDALETILPTVEAMGRRHAGYGVTAAHYASVGTALLWTLEKGLGAAWNAAAADAWTTAYTLVSTVMRDAQRGDGVAHAV